ncbi:hypothetical protein NEOLEDRAFT_1171927 [Neolentinus lepideus HHB14362 ss-1]|uniref:Uncharacterized protein n=1 Tax=Neolentinus lepideus HHB14362 ss-1 TaxID=1314782 RepID=A0A165PT30_9AGAM|nr:hypothetical protein NEOLEDRAFT_1171927 [Neolentinus lepideus HHB14362 ss-1]
MYTLCVNTTFELQTASKDAAVMAVVQFEALVIRIVQNLIVTTVSLRCAVVSSQVRDAKLGLDWRDQLSRRKTGSLVDPGTGQRMNLPAVATDYSKFPNSFTPGAYTAQSIIQDPSEQQRGAALSVLGSISQYSEDGVISKSAAPLVGRCAMLLGGNRRLKGLLTGYVHGHGINMCFDIVMQSDRPAQIGRIFAVIQSPNRARNSKFPAVPVWRRDSHPDYDRVFLASAFQKADVFTAEDWAEERLALKRGGSSETIMVMYKLLHLIAHRSYKLQAWSKSTTTRMWWCIRDTGCDPVDCEWYVQSSLCNKQ